MNLEKMESIAKIISYIGIPIVLLFFSSLLKKNLEQKKLDQTYVQIAISIINEKNTINPDLRDWAVDLFKDHSPTPISGNVIESLKNADYNLSNQTASSSNLNEMDQLSREDDWFTVVGSFGKSKEVNAISFAEKYYSVLRKVPGIDSLCVYRTIEDRVYAVTANGPTKRSIAVKFTRALVDSNFIHDAYAQINRDWEFIHSVK